MQQIFFAVLSVGLLGCVLSTPAPISTVAPTSATNGTNTTAEVPTTNVVTSSAKMSTAHGGSSITTTSGTNVTTPVPTASNMTAAAGSSGTSVTSYATGGQTTHKAAATTHGTSGGAESVWRTSTLVVMVAVPLLKMLGTVH